jgi:hypothetical protein
MFVDRSTAVRLLTMMAEGRLEDLLREPWKPEYGPDDE